MNKVFLSWLIVVFSISCPQFASNVIASSDPEIPSTAKQISEKLNNGRKATYHGNLYIWEDGTIYEIGDNGHRSIMRGVEQQIIEKVNPLAILDADNIESTCNGDSRSVSSKIAIIIESFHESEYSVLVKTLWIPSGWMEKSELDIFGKKCIQNLKKMFVQKGIHNHQFRVPEKLQVRETNELVKSLLVEVIRVN